MSFLSKFMPWKCTPVLPTVYDDSLSYMELLCKLTKSIDNLSEHISTLESTLIDEISSITQKLDTAILYTEQSLTEEQQAQARANIGASVVRSLTLEGVTLGDGTIGLEYAETEIELDEEQQREFLNAIRSDDPVILTIKFVDHWFDLSPAEGSAVPFYLPMTFSVPNGVYATFSANANALSAYGANKFYVLMANYKGTKITVSGQLIDNSANAENGEN